jgi:single-strand DNA-binding protein
MASFNQVTLVGNLTRDPELRYTPGGTAVCDLSLAVNEKWKGKDGQMNEEVSFIDCTCWGKTAEVAAKYLSKGRSCLVSGRLKQDRWDDKTTGAKRSKIHVVVNVIQFLGAKGEGKGGPAADAGADPVEAAMDSGGAPMDENTPF